MIRRDLGPQDEPRFLETLRDPASDLGIDVPFEPRRSFLDAPGGTRPFLIRAEEGGATWAGRRRPVWLDGKRTTFAEVAPLSAPLAGTDPVDPRDEDAVLWSLTTSREWERLELELGFELVRTPLQLVASPSDVSGTVPPGIVMSRPTAFPDDVQVLGERLAAECGALAVRDKAFLDWRFGAPRRDYRIVLAHRGSQLAGCAVFRRGTFDGRRDQGLVVEWLVPREEVGVGRALRAAVAEVAREEGAARLVVVVPEWTEEWMRFQNDGFHAEPTRYVLCARHRQRRHDAFWLFKNWYYTLADGGLA